MTSQKTSILEIVCLSCIVLAFAATTAFAQVVEEYHFNPDLTWGGRSVAATVHPTNPNAAIEAAEGGGLYKTLDGGITWDRIESFPMFRMADVMYDPEDPNIVIATTIFDGRVDTQSGIWRSTDGGATWARANVAYECTDAVHAYKIDIPKGVDVHHKVFVANRCGIAYSNDSGETWQNLDPAGGDGRSFSDVAVVRRGPDQVRVYAAGSGGIYRADINAAETPIWTVRQAGYPANKLNKRAGSLAISPFDSSVVFFATLNCPSGGCVGGDDVHRIFESGDGGVTWTELPGPGSRNRPDWIETQIVPNTLEFDLYWGNGVHIYRQHCRDDNNHSTLDCPVAPDPDCSNAIDDDGDGFINEGCPKVGADPEKAGAVPGQCKNNVDDDGDGFVNDGCAVMELVDNGCHSDPSGIAFETGSHCPKYISSDGGIGRTTDCGLSWADSNSGRYALQIYNAFGTVRGAGATDTDIYFGTQDNAWWYTLNNGGSWANPGCCEGFGGQVDRRTPPGGTGDIRLVWANGAPFNAFYSPRGWTTFSALMPIAPIGYTGSAPTIFGNQRWAQIGHDRMCPPSRRLYVMQPETGTQCDNNTDDDFDGAVNDGCPQVGTGAEIGVDCHNNIDDDGDSEVNDGCSHIISYEQGTECNNATDDDGDGIINDGCPKNGDAENFKKSDCANGVVGQCSDATDDDGDGVINDGCPHVGVWTPVGPSFTEGFRKPLLASMKGGDPTFYFGVEVASKTYGLRKLAAPLSPTTPIQEASGSGSFALENISGYTGAGGTWYSSLVFGVDPNEPDRLIAPDSDTEQMKRSYDGGLSWVVDQDLTDLVTRDGEFNFDGSRGSEVWSVAWDPEDSTTILVGTEQAGIVVSVNGGGTWFTLKDTYNRVPFVNSFFFDQDHDDLIYASTYGRGLWSFRIDNLPPVAVCQDVETTTEPGVCYANASIDDGSWDPEGGPLTYDQVPPSPYPLGDTVVTLTVTDDFGYTDDCSATVTVIDDEPPVIYCNAPPTITPPDAPISFTSTAIDNCSVAETVITAYDCYKFTKKGKIIDKKSSCVVDFEGNTVTIFDSGGVGDFITWTVVATDGSGNSTTDTCLVEVVNPGQT
jgi:photosystem II stability/assembly factor-like uncharacterized protein